VTSTTDAGAIVTVTVFALLLPHPFTVSIAHPSAANAHTPLQIFSHFIKTSSPAKSGPASPYQVFASCKRLEPLHFPKTQPTSLNRLSA
jgi:hypothetical protein